jgi:EmrB/QacA subfamily drug resistance transporter
MPARWRRWAVLPVVLTGTFMIVLDFFIVNVALPSMQAELHADSGAIEWVVAGYGVTFATTLITAGRLGDRFGRRRMFSLGLALFTLSSAACGVAPSPSVLVLARLVQGLAAAMIAPQVLAIIGVVYPGAERAKAMAAYGLTLGLAAVGAQLIGGVLVQSNLAGLGWRAIFLINVPIGVAALIVAAAVVPESRAERAGRVDLIGTVLVTSGLVAVVLPLVEGRQHGWPEWTWLSLAVAPALLGAFALHQRRLSRRGRDPLLDPALFTRRPFTAGLATQLVFWCGQASFFLVLALYLQQGRGLDPLAAGAVFTILAAGYFATSMVAPALTIRLGRRLPGVGALVLAAGHAALAVAVVDAGGSGSVALLVPGLLMEGAGMGLVITPLMTTVLSGMEPERAGAATGALSAVQQVGNAVGVAVTSVIFFGAVHGGYSHAFGISLVELTGLLLAVAGLTWLLPRQQPSGLRSSAAADGDAPASRRTLRFRR